MPNLLLYCPGLLLAVACLGQATPAPPPGHLKVLPVRHHAEPSHSSRITIKKTKAGQRKRVLIVKSTANDQF